MPSSDALAISLPSTGTCVLDVGRTDGSPMVGSLVACGSMGLSLGLSLGLALGLALGASLGVSLGVWFGVLLVEASVAGSLEGPFGGRVSVERLSGASFRLFAGLPCIFS